jgi:glycosyltransferase involved in cell wall biosynthesis
MKLLHVITTLDPKTGGPSQGLKYSIPILITNNVSVDVVSLDDPNCDFIENSKIIVHKIGKGTTTFQYSKELDHWLDGHIANYDFVCVHGIWQYHNYAVYKAVAKLRKKGVKVPKVAIMSHGMLDPYFQTATDRRFKALRNLVVWKITEKKAINAADAVFFTCEEEMNLARRTFKGYQPKTEINVGYGIQRPPIFEKGMKRAFEELYPELQNKRYWLFLSRIHPKKGIELLIDVYNILVMEGHVLPELVIAGSTDSEFARKMVSLAQGNSHIHFLGMVSGKNKWALFYGCESFLLPSYQENFGIAIVEALACEKPVLITKQINIWYEIYNGQCGWIMEKPDKNELKQRLIQISKYNQHELKQIGFHAFNTFEDKFMIEQCTKAFIDAFRSL